MNCLERREGLDGWNSNLPLGLLSFDVDDCSYSREILDWHEKIWCSVRQAEFAAALLYCHWGTPTQPRFHHEIPVPFKKKTSTWSIYFHNDYSVSKWIFLKSKVEFMLFFESWRLFLRIVKDPLPHYSTFNKYCRHWYAARINQDWTSIVNIFSKIKATTLSFSFLFIIVFDCYLKARSSTFWIELVYEFFFDKILFRIYRNGLNISTNMYLHQFPLPVCWPEVWGWTSGVGRDRRHSEPRTPCQGRCVPSAWSDHCLQ